MGNYYSSPKPARSLKTYQTNCVRTLKLNRKNVPEKVKDTKLKTEGMTA
jgi:hypothetical protein